jgi:putative transposase
MAVETILRAYKFALDPTPVQAEEFARHAGAARWGYNYALARKQAAHQAWRGRVDELVASGQTEAQAKAAIKASAKGLQAEIKDLDGYRRQLVADKKELKASGNAAALAEIAAQQTEVRAQLLELKLRRFSVGDAVPSSMDMAAIWRTERDRPHDEGGSPWWSEVNVYCFTGGFDRADASWKNWLDSHTGKRAGRRVGYPRFKKKGRAKDSFSLFHDVKNPSIRVAETDYRHVRLSSLGMIRTHDSTKRLRRQLNKHAVIKSVTVSRSGHRWYASVLTEVQQPIPDRPTRRQRVGGLVGADLGSTHLAVLSNRLNQSDPASQVVDPPKPLNAALKRLKRAQQAVARTEKGSNRRRRTVAKVAKLHHQVAQQRATALHHFTKRLATGFATVVIEDLDLVGLTASAKGTVDDPGRNVKLRSQFNRHLLDNSPGEIERQLAYKTTWYGSQLVRLDRSEATTATCSTCGTRNPNVSLSASKYNCGSCGLVLYRHENSARNIARAGRRQLQTAAQDNGEAQNARGALVSLPREGERGASKREDPPP